MVPSPKALKKAVQRTWVLLFLCTFLALVISSCGNDHREEILVFAAASLTDVMDQLGREFTEREGVKTNFNFGGSTELAQQIIRGAPADALVFAGLQPVEVLEERGLLATHTRVDLLRNELVLVGRDAAHETGIDSVEDLARADGKVAIAVPELAPAGWYAREALQNMGLWQQLEPRLVFALNVRFALSYVESGNADAGIVYRTDTMMSKDLQILASIPEESYSPIVYPAAAVGRSRHLEAAQKFLLFLQGDEATEAFQRHGFLPQNRE